MANKTLFLIHKSFRFWLFFTAMCDQKNYSKQDDYKSFDVLRRYKLHLELATYEQATKICESENAHLVVIDSEAEVAVMKELAVLAETHEIYAGVNDFKKQGSFLDIFGKKFIVIFEFIILVV